MKKLVCGVGINDANYAVDPRSEGNRQRCPFYAKWRSMLKRCYSDSYHAERPTYKDCTVSDEWLIFSAFREWMSDQDWEGKHLDKDLLSGDQKVYSESTCIFVSHQVNSFLLDCRSARGIHSLGVHFHKSQKNFQANIRDGKGKRVFLGKFNSEQAAHEAWAKEKHKMAIALAEEQDDERVASALFSFAEKINLNL